MLWHGFARICPEHGNFYTGRYCSQCGVAAALAAGYMPA